MHAGDDRILDRIISAARHVSPTEELPSQLPTQCLAELNINAESSEGRCDNAAP